MPKRGSAQLLLLSFRSRVRPGWAIGAAAIVLVLLAVSQTADRFLLMERTGFAQLLQQSAWKKVLAGQPEQSWPWEDPTFVPAAKVPRLGLSAAVLTGAGEGADIARKPLPGTTLGKTDKDLRDVAVGDRITVTTPDGSSQVYRVTGRRVVDPHLAEPEPAPGGAEVSLVTCWPLDPCVTGSQHLVIHATPDNGAVVVPARGEHKL